MSKQFEKISSPQGKGVVSVVDDLLAFRPIAVKAKDSYQWLADYFTSALVLGAKFSFKPVYSKDYYLYFKQGKWKLSMIEPHAWKSHDPGTFFASCVLNYDMSWSLKLAKDWQKDSSLETEIRKKEAAFFTSIQDERPLVEKLPFYIHSLSYYQKLCAHSLAHSLSYSLQGTFGKRHKSITGHALLTEVNKRSISLLGKNNDIN